MCSLVSTAVTRRSTPASTPLEDLGREICELSAHLAAATCRWLMLLAEWDRRGGWAEWGCGSCAQWLSWRCGIAPGAARERLRVARRLTELPLVREAFGTGELSYCKVRALTRVAVSETEAHLVEIARHATGAQLERLVRSYSGALSATLGAARSAYAERYLTWNWEQDGSLSVRARLPADEGALLLSALGDAEQREPSAQRSHPAATVAPDRSGAPDTSRATNRAGDWTQAPHATRAPDADQLAEEAPAGASARRADALICIARAALAAGDAPRTGADPCEIVVHVDADSLASEEITARSELSDGPSLAPETVRRLGCDAALVRVTERDGRPLSAGRRTRTIPPALRRALRSRDHECCRFPGCTHRRFLHAHHIHHWARGGETKLENLIQLCSHHHRLVHEGGFGVEPAGSGRVRFRRPDGREIDSVCRAPVAVGPSVEQRHAAAGIVIDANTCRPLSAGDRLDYGIAVEGLLARQLAGT
jgi:5-methylcytosine-specific restriction endonuclease McrA